MVEVMCSKQESMQLIMHLSDGGLNGKTNNSYQDYKDKDKKGKILRL